MFKCGVLKHTLEGLLACLKSSEVEGLLACLKRSQAYIGRSSRLFNVEFPSGGSCLFKEFSSIHWKVFCLFKCGVLKHTLEGLLACLNREFTSIHWKVFLLV